MKKKSAIGGVIERMEAASAGFVALSASLIQDVGGNRLASGTLEVQPTDGNNVPITAAAGGAGGQMVSRSPAIFTISGGVLQAGAQIADTTQTLPQNICYRFTIKDATGTPISVIKLVQTLANTAFNLDTYQPNVAPQAIVQKGPSGQGFIDRGLWQPNTPYAPYDVFTGPDGITYRVPPGATYTSGATFASTGLTPTAAAAMYLASDNFALFQNAGYLNASGQLVADLNWRATDYLDISRITVFGIGLFQGALAVVAYAVAFYDQAYTFLGGASANATASQILTTQPAPLPNTKYVRYMMHAIGNTGGVTDYQAIASSQFFQYLVTTGRVLDTLNALDPTSNVSLDMSALAPFAGYITPSNGVFQQDVNWKSTDFIPCHSGQSISVNVWAVSGLSVVSFYNASKGFIGGNPGPGTEGVFQATYQAPSQTAFYRVSFGNPATYSNAAGTIPSVTASVLGPVGMLQASTPVQTALKLAQSLTDRATLPGFVDTSGVYHADSRWCSTDYLPCAPNQKVAYSLYGASLMSVLTFFSAAGAVVSIVAGGSGGAVTQGVAVVPSSAVTLRISFAANFILAPSGGSSFALLYYSSSDIGSIAAGVNSVNAGLSNVNQVVSALSTRVDAISGTINSLSPANAIALATPFRSARKLGLKSTDTILLYGDSRSSTDYPWYAQDMAAASGAQVTAGGFSGSIAAFQAANAQLQSVFNFNPSGLIIVHTGGNDQGAPGSVGTFAGLVAGEPTVTETDITQDYSGTYFIQAVSHMMRKINSHFYNIRARAGLTGSETEAQKTALIDAVTKPILVFTTDARQQRNNANDPYSSPANWMRKRAAIIECCNKYNVACIDTMVKFAPDMSQEPFYVSPTNLTNNQGVYYMDGLHLNKYGNQWLVQLLAGELNF